MTLHAVIPESQWQQVGDNDGGEDPKGRLLATMSINGISFHVDAFEVKYDEEQRIQAAQDEWDDLFGEWYQASGSDGPVQTVEIFGRQYALFASPYCL